VSTIADRAPGAPARPAPPRHKGRGARTGLAALALLAAALLALALLGALALPAPAASSSSAKTLQLAAVTIQATTLDLGAPGPSQGDESILTRELFLDGQQVGTSHLVATLTLVAGADSQSQTVATFSLPDGQLTAQGLVTASQTANRVAAITGGTGAYRQAGGQVTVTRTGPTTADITLLIRDLG
jgi:Allene oxide cyclase barrel like domain